MKILLDNLTTDQQLQLLLTQNKYGNTAVHFAVQYGYTKTVKTLLDNLAPEQQLKLLSVQNEEGKTASQEAKGEKKYIKTILVQYQIEADYAAHYREFTQFAQSSNHIKYFS